MENIGNLDASAFTVIFYDDDVQFHEANISSLNRSSSQVLENVSWTPMYDGNHQIKVVIDGKGSRRLFGKEQHSAF